MRGRKVGEGLRERKGLARGGTRWPSGARSTQPSQTVQVAGALRLIGAWLVKERAVIGGGAVTMW